MTRIYSRAGSDTSQQSVAPSTLSQTSIDDEDYKTGRSEFVRHAAHETRDARVVRPDDLRAEFAASAVLRQTSLDAPTPRHGFAQRWIAEAPALEFAKRMRQGWEPRDPSTVPEAERRYYETAKSNSGQDMIRIGGLILCEMPVVAARARKNAVDQLISSQLASIPQSMQELEKKRFNGVGALTVTNEERSAMGRMPATMVE